MALAFSRHLVRFRSILTARLLAAAILTSFSMASARAADMPILDRPMEFLLVHGDSGYCRSDGTCADWISAEGQIFADSPGKLQKLLKRLGNRKLPILVRSPGGDVAAAMQMGLIIRKNGLSVAVGGSRANDCPYADPLCKTARAKDGSVTGASYSIGAVCLSACPLILAGGVRRIASSWSPIGVHQITTTYREVRVQYRTEYEVLNGRKKILSKQEVGRKMVGKRDTTKLGSKQRAALIAYLDKMGVDPSLFDLMMSATPQSIRLLSPVEALNLHMTTEMSTADLLVTSGPCPAGKTLQSCMPPVAAPQPPSVTPPSPPLPDSTEPGLPQPNEQQATNPTGDLFAALSSSAFFPGVAAA
jgi:hypothetical protein